MAGDLSADSGPGGADTDVDPEMLQYLELLMNYEVLEEEGSWDAMGEDYRERPLDLMPQTITASIRVRDRAGVIRFLWLESAVWPRSLQSNQE